MGQRPSIEVLQRADERCFILVVEPPTAVQSLRQYLEAQPDEVQVAKAEVAGDLTVNLLNGKSLEQIVGGVAIITKWHKAVLPTQTPSL